MYKLITIFCFLLVLFGNKLVAQQKSNFSYEDVNTQSYALYEKAEWAALLAYGKEAIANKQDFSYLRLRLGYAAFMIGNYNNAIQHYEKVLKNDSYNSTARYFVWLCRKYLNQNELANLQLAYFTPEMSHQYKVKKWAFTGVGLEVSYKSTDTALRGNTLYEKLWVNTALGSRINMYQAVSGFNQDLLVPNSILPGQPKFRTITINQKEYYNKVTINAANRWQLKLAYHYANTPFDKSVYNNHAGLLGIKYWGNYFDVQASAIMAKVSDSSIQQFDCQIGVYPLGNMNVYGYSIVTFRKRPTYNAWNFRQIIGGKITPTCDWRHNQTDKG